MINSLFQDQRIQKNEESTVQSEKQEDAEHDARDTFCFIHNLKSYRVKNLEAKFSSGCLSEANFQIVTRKRDRLEFFESHLVQSVERL